MAALLDDPECAPNGKDAFGLTALHKLCAWDAAPLLDLLLPRLDAGDLVAPGSEPDKATPLHTCVEMDSENALRRLLADRRVFADEPDAQGRTPRALAAAKAPHLVGVFRS